jgi:hypothetical protein
MTEVSRSSKALILSLSIILFVSKAYEGVCYFGAKWHEGKLSILERYNSKNRTLDWDKFVQSLRMSYSLVPLGTPVWIERVLTIILVVSMIVGLNLRKMFPVFSVFAWGVPCIVASSTLVQILAVNFMQALKVVELERKMGVKICVAASDT